MIEKERIQYLNTHKIQKNNFVIYWMQQSQREEYNHALEYAIELANSLNQPLIVYFGLTDNYPEANIRHYQFLFQGLVPTQKALNQRGILFLIENISPEKGIVNLAKHASIIVTDCGYLHIQREWRKYAAQKILCPLIQVETDAICPIHVVSQKEEYSAGTIRNKIKKNIHSFMNSIKRSSLKHSSLHCKIDLKQPITITDSLNFNLKHCDSSVKPVTWITGGTKSAKKLLQEFVSSKLPYYESHRNDPSQDFQSHMSPFLHFGQISPLYIAEKIIQSGQSPATEAYLEELIIRRELSLNFAYYNTQYANFTCLPVWAKNSLLLHKKDERDVIYSIESLENAETHNPYWNAAQKELLIKGKMHGYMRMYWGKKIIQWTSSPKQAFNTVLYLNNKYSLDGRDANSYAGVAWCFGKHDRAWKERPIFGKIRYMNSNGLKRKFDIENYVKKINALVQ